MFVSFDSQAAHGSVTKQWSGLYWGRLEPFVHPMNCYQTPRLLTRCSLVSPNCQVITVRGISNSTQGLAVSSPCWVEKSWNALISLSAESYWKPLLLWPLDSPLETVTLSTGQEGHGYGSPISIIHDKRHLLTWGGVGTGAEPTTTNLHCILK